MPFRFFPSGWLGGTFLSKRQVFLLLLALSMIIALGLYTLNHYQAIKRELAGYNQSIADSTTILKRFTNQHTAILEFLLSNDELYLASYEDSKLYLLSSFRAAKMDAIQESQAQYQRMASVEQQYRQWLKNFAQLAVGIKYDASMTPMDKSLDIAELLAQQQGKKYADGIRSVLNDYIRLEQLAINDLERKESQLASCMIALLAIVLSIFFYLLWRFVRQASAYYHDFLASIEEIRTGNYGYHIEREGCPEFRELTHAFNNMSDQLSISMEERVRVASTKGSFLTNMSHEIRTSLSGIVGTIEMLKKDELDDSAREKVNLIEESSAILMRVVNDVLDATKIEAGQLELDLQPINLKRCVEAIFKLSAAETRDMDVALELEYDAALPHYFIADEMRIKQILINLVNNAVKFTERGKVQLKVTHHGKLSEQCYSVRFEVIDTGIGIDPDKIQNLFQPFFQENASVAHRYGGTGLGLALCYNLVKLMSGSISVESELQKGTRILFDLPLIQSSLKVPDIKDQEIEKGGFQGKVALVVEDNGINRIVAGAFLEDLGFEVAFAINGQEGINAAERHRYDVIFMDMQMPIVDGVQATKTILETDHDAPPVIGLTANVMDDDIRQCIDAGMETVITKPLSLSKLYGVLMTVDIA